MRQNVIETSFAKAAGYGNPVYSRAAYNRNVDYIYELFGDKKNFDNIKTASEVEEPLD